MSALLKMRNVQVSFGGREKNVALADVSLDVGTDPSSIMAIVGESGSGKTTLTRVLLGLQSPTSGTISFEDLDVRSLGKSQRHRFRRDVQAIFQDPFDVLNPFYVVDHALFQPLKLFGICSSRRLCQEKAESALTQVGLRPQETLGKYPHELSGGQRQRLMIARALMLDPAIIVADEPVSMVDASLRATILDTLYQLSRDRGISLVYVTHDLATAYQVADTVMVLNRGRVMEVGDVESVIKRPSHPYTQALLGAVPSPDPEVAWDIRSAENVIEVGARENGCPFAGRCPAKMPRCEASAPPIYQVSASQGSACYLFGDRVQITAAQVQAARTTT